MSAKRIHWTPLPGEEAVDKHGCVVTLQEDDLDAIRRGRSSLKPINLSVIASETFMVPHAWIPKEPIVQEVANLLCRVEWDATIDRWAITDRHGRMIGTYATFGGATEWLNKHYGPDVWEYWERDTWRTDERHQETPRSKHTGSAPIASPSPSGKRGRPPGTPNPNGGRPRLGHRIRLGDVVGIEITVGELTLHVTGRVATVSRSGLTFQNERGVTARILVNVPAGGEEG
jgi:hypothetical protein